MRIQNFVLPNSDFVPVTIGEEVVTTTGVHKLQLAFAVELPELIDQLFVQVVATDGLTFEDDDVPGLAVTRDGWINGTDALAVSIDPPAAGPGDFAIGFRVGTLNILTAGKLKLVAHIAPNGAAHPGVAAVFRLATLDVIA